MYSSRFFYTCVLLMFLISESKGAVLRNPTLPKTKSQLCVISSMEEVREFQLLIDDITTDLKIGASEIIKNKLMLQKQLNDIQERNEKLSNLYNVLNKFVPGNGWTVIQQRINGNENFNRTWEDYRKGFGRYDGDFFLGLDKIHSLTSAQPHMLSVYLVLSNGDTKYAQYDNFAITDDANLYRLTLGEFSGNVMNDTLSMHTREPFSTYDKDNDDVNIRNCAADYGAGFWFTGCGHV